jgi:hypothetical protein
MYWSTSLERPIDSADLCHCWSGQLSLPKSMVPITYLHEHSVQGNEAWNKGDNRSPACRSLRLFIVLAILVGENTCLVDEIASATRAGRTVVVVLAKEPFHHTFHVKGVGTASFLIHSYLIAAPNNLVNHFVQAQANGAAIGNGHCRIASEG